MHLRRHAVAGLDPVQQVAVLGQELPAAPDPVSLTTRRRYSSKVIRPSGWRRRLPAPRESGRCRSNAASSVRVDDAPSSASRRKPASQARNGSAARRRRQRPQARRACCRCRATIRRRMPTWVADRPQQVDRARMNMRDRAQPEEEISQRGPRRAASVDQRDVADVAATRCRPWRLGWRRRAGGRGAVSVATASGALAAAQVRRHGRAGSWAETGRAGGDHPDGDREGPARLARRRCRWRVPARRPAWTANVAIATRRLGRRMFPPLGFSGPDDQRRLSHAIWPAGAARPPAHPPMPGLRR